MAIAGCHLAIEALDLPSAEQVVGRLERCRIAHFACHGSTDHADPSQSGLILQRRNDAGQVVQDRLTVGRVSEAGTGQRASCVPIGMLDGREQSRAPIRRGDTRRERLPGGRISTRHWLSVAVG